MLDGAMGTLVEDAGYDVRTALWGSELLVVPGGVDLTAGLHRQYVEAGADLVIANTHNAGEAHVRRWLAETPRDRWPRQVAEAKDPVCTLLERLQRDGIAAARRSGASFVAGCTCSPDRPYTTRPTLTPEAVAAGLERQVEALVAAQPDLLIFEMCTTEHDLEGIARLAERLDGTEVGVGLVCGPDGGLASGMPLDEVSGRLAPLRPAALFVQCTPWPQVSTALDRLPPPTDGVLGVYANDGRGWSGSDWTGDRVGVDAYARARVRNRRRAGSTDGDGRLVGWA